MATLHKRVWKTRKGIIKSKWQLTWQDCGIQRRKVFDKKPTLYEMAEITNSTIDNPKIKDFIENNYLPSLEIHCKESTIETYKSYLKNVLKPLYNYYIKDIKRNNIEKFILELKKKLSVKYINNVVTFLKGMFNYAVDTKVIPENPARKIPSLPQQKKKVKVFTEEQMNLFKEKIAKDKLWVNVFFTILINTGMRISECIALEWDDIDFNQQILSINKQYYRFRLTSTKTCETREIEIPNSLINLLNDYKKVNNNKLLFSLNDGKYINVNNVRERYFNKYIKEIEQELNCNMPDITPHCLRHTHASTLLSKGIPIKYVSKRLGHRNQKTTLDIYDHVLQADKKNAIQILNTFY